jgi:hypothetical protein
MSIYDPLSIALGIEPHPNLSYLNKIIIEELILLDKVSPTMSEETKKVLSDLWINYWKDREYPQELRDKISKSLKGRVFTKEHRRKQSEAQKKPIMINDKEYDSGRSAAKDLRVSPACIVKWLKNGKAFYIQCR